MKHPKTILFILLTLLISCKKSSQKLDLVPEQDQVIYENEDLSASHDTKNKDIYEGIGLQLHTMIELKNFTNSFWQNINFGCNNDIIIEIAEENEYDEKLKYQYLLFDYVEKKVVDIITVENSSEPMLFYKSHLDNTLLLENYDKTNRYKYIYGGTVSLIDDVEFLDMINGKYVSEAPYDDSYKVTFDRYADRNDPSQENYNPRSYIEEINFPEAWPVEIKEVSKPMMHSLNARTSYYILRSTDWKIFKNKYVFMLNSDKNSNPFGQRAYYVVKTLDNNLVFTIPKIKSPYLRYQDNLQKPYHNTLIDFNNSQSQVLIKGIYNDKKCIMIYDIIMYDDRTKLNNTTANCIILNNNITAPLEYCGSIESDDFNVIPGTSTLYGVLGLIDKKYDFLYEQPDKNSNIIMRLNYINMDKYKHYYYDGIGFDEQMCFEIINCIEEKNNSEGKIIYWYQILFDSVYNYETSVKNANNDEMMIYDPYDIYKFLEPEMYNELTGWVLGNNVKILDKFNKNVSIINGKK